MNQNPSWTLTGVDHHYAKFLFSKNGRAEMATRVQFDDLDGTYSMDKYDRVLENLPGHQNDSQKETVVWENINMEPTDPFRDLPTPRDLLVIAQENDNVRERLKELGYIFTD